ncbi:MAG: hypothetical protein J6D06_01510 [Clostridia bacterium]|nr:hypothetical protein [Clostridia bacterium]
MKKTGKRVIAVALVVVMTLSVFSVGAIALTSLFTKSNTVTQVAGGSNVINANSVEEAIELMQSTPDFFADASSENVAGAGEDTNGADAVVYPTVIIPGISQSISYLADENGNPAVNSNGEELSGGLLILDSSTILPTVTNNLIAPLGRALIRQNDNDGKLQDAVYNTVSELFSIQASDKTGNPVNNLKTVRYDTSVGGMNQDDQDYFYRMIPMKALTHDTIDVTTGEVVQEAILDENDLYLYAFPLIGDPFESAKGLDEYIQFIKEEKGVDKVNVVTISLGGTILTAYLEMMKDIDPEYSDINRIINVVSCLQGTDVMGDFYMREFKINDPEHPEYEQFFFNEFLPMIMKESNGYGTLGYLINIALKIMPKSVIYAILSGAVEGIIDTLMINCPQFWAMIPTDRYEDVKAKYNQIWTEDDYSELAPKIDKFQEARLNLVDNLNAFAEKDNRLVHNVCGFGLDYATKDYNFFGAMRSSDVTNSDAIIDIDSTSLGATYAPAGQYLPDDVLFAEDAIVSPDGSIDVSTCAFVDTTWFFQNQHHEVGRNDVVLALVGRLVTGEIKSVDDDYAFPRFNGNRNTRNITRWRLDDASALITNYNDGITYDIEGNELTCSQADMDELIAAYKECLALLQDTICEPTAADAATERIEDAIYRVGHNGELPVEDNSMDALLEALCEFLDTVVTAVSGPGNGFSDIFQNGVFPVK